MKTRYTGVKSSFPIGMKPILEGYGQPGSLCIGESLLLYLQLTCRQNVGLYVVLGSDSGCDSAL